MLSTFCVCICAKQISMLSDVNINPARTNHRPIIHVKTNWINRDISCIIQYKTNPNHPESIYHSILPSITGPSLSPPFKSFKTMRLCDCQSPHVLEYLADFHHMQDLARHYNPPMLQPKRRARPNDLSYAKPTISLALRKNRNPLLYQKLQEGIQVRGNLKQTGTKSTIFLWHHSM